MFSSAQGVQDYTLSLVSAGGNDTDCSTKLTSTPWTRPSVLYTSDNGQTSVTEPVRSYAHAGDKEYKYSILKPDEHLRDPL